MNPIIFVIILNWNGKENTLKCLESIRELRTENLELRTIVVDNGSTDGLVESIKSIKDTKSIKSLGVIENEKNLGYSGGNNVGIRYALQQGADYILILNNDTIADKNLLIELLKVAESDRRIGIVSPKIYFAAGFEFHKGRYKKNELGKVIWYAGGIMDWKNVLGHHKRVDEVDRGQHNKIEETDFASGCCMFVKREMFEKVGPPAGGFDERYFLYYEDNDLSQRVKKAGYTIIYSPKAMLWHKNAGSAGGSGSTLQDYYITRNRMLFGMRHAPTRSKIALVKESVRLLLYGRFWQRWGILDFYLGRFGKGSYT